MKLLSIIGCRTPKMEIRRREEIGGGKNG